MTFGNLIQIINGTSKKINFNLNNSENINDAAATAAAATAAYATAYATSARLENIYIPTKNLNYKILKSFEFNYERYKKNCGKIDLKRDILRLQIGGRENAANPNGIEETVPVHYKLILVRKGNFNFENYNPANFHSKSNIEKFAYIRNLKGRNINGGSSFVYVSKIGRRKLRYTKTGRKFIINKGKRKYLS